MRKLFWLPLIAAGCSTSRTPPPALADPPARCATPGLEAAIANLADEDCEIRRLAAEELKAAGREALPLLAEARKSSDIEVMVNAGLLTREIETASEPLVWIGTRDDRWENPENWSPKMVPGPYSTAIIPSTPNPLYAPTIRGQVQVKDLVLLRHSSLTVEETAKLSVDGTLKSRGTLRALGVVQSSE